MDEEAVAESVQVLCVVSVVFALLLVLFVRCVVICVFCSGCAALGFMCFFQVVGSGCTESQQAGLNKDLTVGPVRFFAYVLNYTCSWTALW